MSIYLMPYRVGLRSTAALREVGFVIRNDHARMQRNIPVLYWGRVPQAQRSLVDTSRIIINPDPPSGLVSNKRAWADAQFSDSIEYTTSIETARSWAGERGEKTICRTTLTGHSGEGIVVARRPEEVVESPLYSRYFKKVREFRAYVAIQDGYMKVHYLASKRNRGDVTDPDDLLIRSGEKGWVYQVEDPSSYVYNPELDETIVSFSSEFRRRTAEEEHSRVGWILAVDIAQNSDGVCKILEANLAPGLNDGTAGCIKAAADWIVEMIDEV